MNTKIIDMDEMSESIEIYNKEPKRLCIFFIYFILVFSIIVCICSYFIKIEDVLKISGIIKNNKENIVVLNTFDGSVKECKVVNGEKVKKGDVLYEIDNEEKEYELGNLKNTLADINSYKSMLNTYIMFLEGKIKEWDIYCDNRYFSEFNYRKKTLELDCKQIGQIDAERNITNEIALMYKEKSDYESKYTETNNMIKKLENDIKKGVVLSPSEGIIKMDVEIYKGSLLNNGQEVMQIIPTEEKNIIECYVAESDVGKIKKNMKTKFDLFAYPAKDYDYIYGKLVDISNTSFISEIDGNSYYTVKIIIEKCDIKDEKKNEITIKSGLNGRANIVTAKKRLLVMLLEKLNLIK